MYIPQHNNPSPDRTASAPYNFVPLPEIVVKAVEKADDLPNQDRFHSDRHTGYFDVTLTAKSPLYVRAMLTREEYERQNDPAEEKKPFRDRVKNKASFFSTKPSGEPVIPGSSLRGMLRNLLEIMSYGKITDVMASPKIFFRAVAAAKDDPLAGPYREVLGKFGRNVRAGYLSKRGDGLYIQPAMHPKDLNLPERSSYLSVKEKYIPVDAIPGLIRLNSENYKPQYYKVSFEAEKRQGKFGPYVAVTKIGTHDNGYSHRGTLVCTGNMLETDGGRPDETGKTNKSPRVKFAIVLPTKQNAQLVRINSKAIEDYLDALTEFQKEEPFDKQLGMLQDGRPIFYVDSDGDEIYYFGHCPNFRIPAMNEDEKRAATPNDFVPGYCKDMKTLDFAEAIFGHTKGPKSGAKQGEKAYAYASRVFVTDAKCDEKAPWLQTSPIVPRVLASPKPTAFQHYLVQQNPNSLSQLYHYGSQTAQRTVIRGFKYYWRQGKKKALTESEWKETIEERDADALKKLRDKPKEETQHTQFKPVKPGTRFTFRIYFENLSDVELGALCWTLQPFGDASKEYCHSLGMGKPLGMGAAQLAATLHLTTRAKRYEKLFNESGAWHTGERNAAVSLSKREQLQKLIQPFEQKLLNELKPDRDCKHFFELRRIGMLMKMLEWPGFRPVSLESNGGLTITEDGKRRPNTRYMTIRRPVGGNQFENEYKQRPVLPDPSAFGELTGEAVPTAELKFDPSPTDFSRESRTREQRESRPSPRYKAPRQETEKKPLELTPEARAMQKSVEKQRQLEQAAAQSAYRNSEVEKKAKVIKNPDGTLSVVLPKLKDKAFPLKPKRQFSQAKVGTKIRVRVVVDKKNMVIRVEEL